MQMHITRPVVIASEAGLRHLAPGLVVELSDAETKQVLRQGAGSACSEPDSAKQSTRKKTAQAVSQE